MAVSLRLTVVLVRRTSRLRRRVRSPSLSDGNVVSVIQESFVVIHLAWRDSGELAKGLLLFVGVRRYIVITVPESQG